MYSICELDSPRTLNWSNLLKAIELQMKSLFLPGVGGGNRRIVNANLFTWKQNVKLKNVKKQQQKIVQFVIVLIE